MSSELRDAYKTIAQDYLSKKAEPWKDFEKYFSKIVDQNFVEIDPSSSILDLGGGNGRNSSIISNSLLIVGDLSFELLQGVGDKAQSVALALPRLPFRKGSIDLLLLIAVLHHFRSSIEAVDSLVECRRINPNGKSLISVWRKWRKSNRYKLIDEIKQGKKLHQRFFEFVPWHNNDGTILTRRYYHYYTFKEIKCELDQAGFQIVDSVYLGGKSGSDNIFLTVDSL